MATLKSMGEHASELPADTLVTAVDNARLAPESAQLERRAGWLGVAGQGPATSRLLRTKVVAWLRSWPLNAVAV